MDSPAQEPPRKSYPWAIALIVFIVAFDVAFFWQRAGGSYQSEFGGHPDEAAHVVTGLFIRDAILKGADYATNGFHGSPVKVGKEFAGEYYSHYPKIGLGVWPPVFYLAQAAWTLPLGVSRTTLLLLMCALAGALALVFYRALREEYGAWPALAGAIALLSLPLVRMHYGMIMAETLSALFMFGAMLCFGNFLDRERRNDVLWFGLFAALAILTKGTGLALALAGPLALAITKEFRLLKRPALWSAVLIIVLVAGPWTWATRNLGKGGWLQPEPSWSFTREALLYYGGKFGLALGVVYGLAMAIGLIVKLRPQEPHRGRWAAAAALMVGVVIFQSIAPVGLEARHLIPALPAALMFSVAGFAWVIRRVLRLGVDAPISRSAPWIAMATLLALFSVVFPIRKKDCGGFGPLAETMLKQAAPADVVLISSDATGEGMFIAEVALREKRPGHMIQRASKSLASSTWSGSGYAPAFEKEEDLLTFMTSGQIQFLVIDDAGLGAKRRAHHDQLRDLVERYPQHFQPVAETDLQREGQLLQPSLKLYQIPRRN